MHIIGGINRQQNNQLPVGSSQQDSPSGLKAKQNIIYNTVLTYEEQFINWYATIRIRIKNPRKSGMKLKILPPLLPITIIPSKVLVNSTILRKRTRIHVRFDQIQHSWPWKRPRRHRKASNNASVQMSTVKRLEWPRWFWKHQSTYSNGLRPFGE